MGKKWSTANNLRSHCKTVDKSKYLGMECCCPAMGLSTTNQYEIDTTALIKLEEKFLTARCTYN